jgi:histone arginine demethylase JMJD6
MANKKVSELVQITWNQLRPQDLFLLSDVIAHESKKLTLQDLDTYIFSAGLSGSLLGTASYAIQAISTSYSPSQVTASYSSTSSWAFNISTASYALQASSASWSLSGSYVLTASYAITSSAQMALSSSYANLATYANSASYLVYTPGIFNGSASYALASLTSSYALTSTTSSYTLSSSFSSTSSYITASKVIGTVNRAIYSDVAQWATVGQNGVFAKLFALSSGSQSQTGITIDTPDTASGLMVSINAAHPFPTYLINMSVAVGGVTGVVLWRISPYDPPGGAALISSIAVSSASLSGVETISATYVDLVSAVTGDPIFYLGCVYNPSGYYYLNQSVDGTQFGTSSLSVIEF